MAPEEIFSLTQLSFRMVNCCTIQLALNYPVLTIRRQRDLTTKFTHRTKLMGRAAVKVLLLVVFIVGVVGGGCCWTCLRGFFS